MEDRNLPPIREQDLWIETNLSGKVELTAVYNKKGQHWWVRLRITDERCRNAYDYCEAVKLPETASKEKVRQTAISQIIQWFGRLNDFWLPHIAEAVKPPTRRG